MEVRAWGSALALAALMGALAPPSRGPAAESALVALAAALAALHLLFSVQPLQSARVLAMCAAGGIVLLCCARAAIVDPRSRRAAWIALAVAGTILSLQGLWQSLAGFQQIAAGGEALPEAMRARLESGRAVATLGLPGALAGFLALSLPVTVSIMLQARAALRLPAAGAALAAALLQAAALIAARSAAAMAALGIALACVAWRSAGGKAGRRLAIGALAGGIAVSGALLAWRMGSAAGAMEGAGPLALRAGNWKAALLMAADRPLFGGGLGSYGILFPAYRTWWMNESRYAHNTWLQLAAEIGLPGALAAGGLAFWLVARLLRRRAGEGGGGTASARGAAEEATTDRGAAEAAGAVACLAFLVHNLADFTFYLPSVALPFFCLAGFELGRTGVTRAAAGRRAPAARLLACAAVALFALWTTRADAGREAARDLAARGSTAAAVEAAREALALNPIDPESHGLLSRLLLDRAAASGDPAGLPEAETHAARAVDLDEMTPGRWNLLGRVRLARSDMQGAYVALHRAAELYPIQIAYREDRDAVAAMLSRGAGTPEATPPSQDGRAPLGAPGPGGAPGPPGGPGR